MTNPIIVDLPADTWKKVATSVTAGFINVIVAGGNGILQTYVDTGDDAPDDDVLAVILYGYSAEIINDVPIDVYLKAVKTAGAVRMDL